jgi:hypothetical protein
MTYLATDLTLGMTWIVAAIGSVVAATRSHTTTRRTARRTTTCTMRTICDQEYHPDLLSCQREGAPPPDAEFDGHHRT